MDIVNSPCVIDRRDFGALLNYYDLVDAVEVGVDRGDFAFNLLNTWRGHRLWLVDPYEPYPEMKWDRTADRLQAVNRLAGFGDRARFVGLDSISAAIHLRNDIYLQNPGVGFVYVDAAHNYESVKADLTAWWPMLKAGGIMAGHDWNQRTFSGVVNAVSEFVNRVGVSTIYITQDKGLNRSWYFFKS